MNLRKTGESRHHLIDLGIVFHGAGTQRIELGLDSEISVRETEKWRKTSNSPNSGIQVYPCEAIPGIAVWPFPISAGQ